MRTVTLTLYTFDELTADARTKAIEHLRDINVDFPDWHEPVLEQAKQDLAAAGYEGAEIRYQGFWSQGDGASFTARLDLRAWLRTCRLAGKYRALAADAEEASVAITQGGSYCHEYTMGVSARYHGRSARADAQLEQLQEQILEDARDRAHDIYRALEREYEYQTNDEQVIAAIRANAYEFDSHGALA